MPIRMHGDNVPPKANMTGGNGDGQDWSVYVFYLGNGLALMAAIARQTGHHRSPGATEVAPGLNEPEWLVRC